VAEHIEHEAVQAIREFLGPAATRADAATVLPAWAAYHQWRYSDLDWAAVLDEFDGLLWPASLHTNGSTP
jgi:predicted NAD/FAD-dependent oxidoreductase